MDLKKNDVHYWTAQFKKILDELNIKETPVDEKELFKFIEDKYKAPQIVTAINNIKKDVKDGKYLDPQLGDHNVLYYLNNIKEADELKDTLIEIGNTCKQGISVRVAYLYLALNELLK